MSSKWKTVSLGDCVNLTTGYPFKSSGYTDSVNAVRLLRGDNIGQGILRWNGAKKWPNNDSIHNLKDYELSDGDVVLAMDRPWIPAGLKFGRVRKIDLPALLVQRVARLRPSNGITANYLFSILSSREFSEYIQNVSTGTAVPHISAAQIRSYAFELPDVETQLQIGSFHSVLDDRISLLRETNKTLESIAQAIFKSWFVDFDPVRSKMEGRQPEGMDEETASLFPDSFEESPQGLIPQGWTTHSMSDISTVGIGKTPPRKEQHWFSTSSKNVPWVSIKDMGEFGIYTEETNEYLVKDAVEKFNVRIVPTNTVIMSFKMTIGRLAITDRELTTNEAIAHFKLEKNSPLSSEYIFLHLKNFDFSRLSSTSSIADAINSKTVRALPIMLPLDSVLKEFQKKISPLFEQIKNIAQQASTLICLRDTLLPRLISGQLRLPEAQEQVKDALS